MNAHKWILQTLIITISLMFFVNLSSAGNPDKERNEIREKKNEILNKLYSISPSARYNIKNAAGYAVFSNFGMKIFFAGGGTGKGIAIENKTKKETFMKMVEVQAGLGMGAKKFALVWVFENKMEFNEFIYSGWEISGEGTAAATYDEEGAAFQGAMSISPGVWLYHMTEDGLALQLTAKGTKYYRDDDLNNY